MIYEIKVKGQLDPHWSEWFDGLAMTHDEQGHTILSGSLVDQAALHGLLIKIRDMSLPLISVNQVNSTNELAVPCCDPQSKASR
jgi:hypothetical protein